MTFAYYINDHLGSTRAVFDGNGSVIEADMYDAYGKLKQLAYSGTSSAFRNKFTGKELDGDGAVAGKTEGLQLYYFGARYYDPEIGIFISSDPEDQYWNAYSYCVGDPVNLVDPDGRAAAAFVAPVAWLLKKVVAGKFLEFIIPTFVHAAPAFIGAIAGLYVYETFLRPTLAPWTIEPQSETPWVKNYVNQQTDNIMHNENSATKQVQDNLAKSMHLNENAQAGDGAKEGGKTVDELKNESKPGRETKGKTEQWDKPGGLDQAEQDFKDLNPKNVKDYPNGTKVGELPDGSKVNVRPQSTDGRPTLEIQKANKQIKFRYDKK